ncbi:MAG: hypothetical protein QM279_11540 [Atribacterota bacterium]|jgi:hypothetical protein|nr:hypothetical protein [Atribacterota bacterium]
MEKTTFQKWITSDIPNNQYFFLISLNISRHFWEQYYFPQIKTKFKTNIVYRVENEKTWKEMEAERMLPKLFPEKEIILLDGISEKGALEITQKKSIPDNLIFLFLNEGELTKPWTNVTIIHVGFGEKEFYQWIGKTAGEKFSGLPAAVIKSLYKYWREYNLREEDIMGFIRQTELLPKRTPLDVELFFEKSEKTLLFRFLDALSDRDTQLATKYFCSLQKINYPSSLLVSMIARRFRLMAQVLITGVENQDLWKKNRVSPFEIRKIKTYSKKFSPSEITNLFYALRHMDRLLKTTNSDFSILMLDFIDQISVRTPTLHPQLKQSVSSLNGI